ncbi:MAG: hypothetical protein ACMXYK_03545 [Candidatus Woesearchaeota archaeon]
MEKDIVYTAAVLKLLGAGKLDTLPDRIKSQKMQYFAQLFGVTPYYTYNLYTYGPYAPDLTKDLFALKNTKKPIQKISFATEEMKERFSKLQSFIKGLTTKELEHIATLHWLLSVVSLSEKDAKQKLYDLKKVTDSQYEAAREKIRGIAV